MFRRSMRSLKASNLWMQFSTSMLAVEAFIYSFSNRFARMITVSKLDRRLIRRSS